MAEYLFAEGVNIYATLFDTNDLATVRGSSQTLEELAGTLHAELGGTLIDQGASRALIRFDDINPRRGAAVSDFLEQSPWCHFTIVHGTGDTPDAAERAARLAQIRGWSVPLSVRNDGEVPDVLNQTHAATETERFPTDTPGKPYEDRPISASVKVRRKKGQTIRPHLYRDGKHPSGMAPPKSLEDLVLTGGQTRMVTDRKIAVVCADGIGGGALREGFGLHDAGRIDYMNRIAGFRDRLARRIEAFLGEHHRFHMEGSHRVRPMLDELVWGGDDMTFVLPAEDLLPFLQVFFEETDRHDPDTFAAGFPHRAGCIVASYKTPIRLMRALASQAEGAVKEGLAAKGIAPQSTFTIDVFESSALPFDSPVAYRKSQYGAGYAVGDDLFLAADAARLLDFSARYVSRDDPGSDSLSLTQIFRALETLRKERKDVCESGAIRLTSDLLKDHFTRQDGNDPPIEDWIAAFSGVPRTLPMLLAQLAQIHPYAERRNG